MGISFNWPTWYGIIVTVMGLHWLFSRRAGSAKPLLSLMLLIALVNYGQSYYQKYAGTHQYKSPLAGASAQTSRTYHKSSGAVSVFDQSSGEEIFAHFVAKPAAQLKQLDQQSNGDWLASFWIPEATALEAAPEMRGWWEREIEDEAITVPFTRCYKSFFGSIRVEDPQTGCTLFVYKESGKYHPIVVAKSASESTGTWRVLFSTQPGLPSVPTE